MEKCYLLNKCYKDCQLLPHKWKHVINVSENLLNEISQLIYSLYQVKEITKKGYKNVLNSSLNEIFQLIYSLYQVKEITKKGYKNVMNSIKL